MDTDALTLKQIRYLLALEETNHFRRAAELCGISQPSLTAQIQNIEEILGVHLVERSRAGVSFTPVGREVVSHAQTIVDAVQNLVDFTAGAQHGLVGTIRLGSKATLGPYLLPHVVALLHKQYPDLNLYVRESPPRELEYELTRGMHDVILAQLPVAGSELVTERLFREPLYLGLTADHPLAEVEFITLKDLEGLEILSLNTQFHLHDQINALCKDFGAIPLRDYEGTSLDALRLMVGMGVGAAFLPAIYAKSEIPLGGEVVVKKIQGKTITRSIGLVWRKSAGRAETYKELASTIRHVIAEKFGDLIIEGN